MSFEERRRTKQLPAAALTALIAALLTLTALGCGSGSDSGGDSPPPPDYSAALESAPPRLQEFYADGDAVLSGGQPTYDRLLEQAEGFPVVVNNWASWCMPCREEFPYFQRQSAAHLGEVAFLGVDSEDSKAAAETFLRDNPLPYPSVEAPGKRDFQDWIGRELVGYPNTIFYDSEGELVYAKQGPYTDEAELQADIEKYALETG